MKFFRYLLLAPFAVGAFLLWAMLMGLTARAAAWVVSAVARAFDLKWLEHAGVVLIAGLSLVLTSCLALWASRPLVRRCALYLRNGSAHSARDESALSDSPLALAIWRHPTASLLAAHGFGAVVMLLALWGTMLDTWWLHADQQQAYLHLRRNRVEIGCAYDHSLDMASAVRPRSTVLLPGIEWTRDDIRCDDGVTLWIERWVVCEVRYWYVLPVLSAPVLFWARLWRRTRRVWAWQQAGCCVGCGYDLRSSPDRCPECGRGRPGP